MSNIDFKVKSGISRAKLREMAQQWKAAPNASLQIGPMGADEIERVADMALEAGGNDFFSAVLVELCERETTSMSTLQKIFVFGNTACRVSICLRNTLSNELLRLCQECKEPIVQEHFQQRH